MKTKDELPVCPVATAVSLIGGKWKLLIIRNLKERPWRFNELQRDIEGISQKVLTDSLRQMIDDGLVYRHDYQEIPPKVEKLRNRKIEEKRNAANYRCTGRFWKLL